MTTLMTTGVLASSGVSSSMTRQQRPPPPPPPPQRIWSEESASSTTATRSTTPSSSSTSAAASTPRPLPRPPPPRPPQRQTNTKATHDDDDDDVDTEKPFKDQSSTSSSSEKPVEDRNMRPKVSSDEKPTDTTTTTREEEEGKQQQQRTTEQDENEQQIILRPMVETSATTTTTTATRTRPPPPPTRAEASFVSNEESSSSNGVSSSSSGTTIGTTTATRSGTSSQPSIHSLGTDLRPAVGLSPASSQTQQQQQQPRRPLPPRGPPLHPNHRQPQGPPPNRLEEEERRPIAPPGQQQQQQQQYRDARLQPLRPSGPPVQPYPERPQGVQQQQRRPPPPHYQQQQQQRPPPQRTGPPPQQQQRRRQPPPYPPGQLQPYQRPPPNKRPPRQLKRLWNRIEQGLDSLANLEDVVSDKASKFYATARDSVTTATETVMGGAITAAAAAATANNDDDDDIPVGSSLQHLWNRRHKSTASTTKMEPTPLMDMSRFQKKVPQKQQQQQQQQAATNMTRPIMRRNATATTTTGTMQPPPGGVPKTAADDGVATNPYGVILETPSIVMQEEKVQTTEQRFQQLQQQVAQPRPKPMMNAPSQATPKVGGRRNIDWDQLTTSPSRIIRANGGASTPPTGGQGDTTTKRSSSTLASTQASKKIVSPPKKTVPKPSSRATAAAPPRRRPSYDSDDESWRSRVADALPSLSMPRLRNPFRRRSSRDMYTMSTLDAWKDDDDKDSRKGGGFFGKFFRADKSKSLESASSESKVAGPLSDLIDRCSGGKTCCLLTSKDKHACSRIGRYQAVMDLLTIFFVIAGLHELPGLDYDLLPASLVEVLTLTLPGVLNSLVLGMDTFAPFAFAAAFLSVQTRKLMHERRIGVLTQSIQSSISEDARYGALFLRLFSATTSGPDMPDRLLSAAHAQITARVDAARLTGLVTYLLALMVLATAGALQPLFPAAMVAIEQVFSLEQLRSWPIQWNELGKSLLSIVSILWTKTSTVIGSEYADITENPMRSLFGFSLAASLAAVVFLARSGGFGETPVPDVVVGDAVDEEDDETLLFSKATDQVTNLGVSSASRLTLLSDSGGIDAALERWRQLIPRDVIVGSGPTLRSLFQLVCKGIGSGFLLVLPLFIYGYTNVSPASTSTVPFPRWDSLFDVFIVLLFAQNLSWKTLSSSATAADLKEGIVGFLSSLASTVGERNRLENAPPANLQLQASVSPAAGIRVSDLWAAHTTKRAWAVRGANIQCRNGEILVVLGDDAAGKSRLMTALGEAICEPPQRAQTTNRVRGTITVGGIDVTKWDNRLLRKRVGLILNDVRTTSDLSQILSGLSLEDILEPSGGLRNLELSHNPGPSERACMMLALKITGLYSTLLPKLPSKMSTIVTANEDDVLKPSTLRPLYQVLSPAEWSKLLLARVLAQKVYANENVSGSNERIENSLMGSLLLLDDATLHLNEVEEARLLRELRKTGAATVFTSNRWASGRFADKIAVIRDGAVVESGTHSELLNRGPQQSLYAAKWHAMTTSP